MANWWQGGGESGGPSEAELRAAGFTFSGGDSGSWSPPAGWARDLRHTMGYAPPSGQKPWFYEPKTTTEELQTLLSQAPYTIERFVETGEGGFTTHDYYDPAAAARTVLAQPKTASVDYIRKNFPSLAQLPTSVLEQMGQDWHTAYAHVQKLTKKSDSGWWGGAGGAEGIIQVPIRIVGDNQPELAVGGNGEMFAEALPYVTYSPEYGLGVPKAGMRPYDDGFSFLDFVGAAAPGIALSAILGPSGFGLSLPAAGAVSGGFNALMNDGNVLKGALTGGALGGFGQLASPVIGSAVGAAGLTGAAADAVSAGALAAGKAALMGGDPLQAALMAAAGSGVSSAVSTLDLVKSLDPSVAKALTAAASGAAKAAVGGVDPVTAALESAFKSGAGSAWSSLTGPAGGAGTPEVPIAEWDSVTPFETPTESWIDRGMLGQSIDWDTQDLLNALGQQEEDQAGMQSALIGYDPRIVAAMEAGDIDQAALQALLASSGAAGPRKTAIGGAAGAAAPKAQTTSGSSAPKSQTTSGAGKAQAGGIDSGSLLALLGLAQQQQAKEPPPVQMVGEITPYDFTSDLLAGVYKPNTMNQYQANDQLLNMARGQS